MRPKSRLFVVSLLVALSMILALVVTPGPPHNVARAAGSTFTVGFAQEPDLLNGNYTNMSFGVWAVYLMQANLWDYDNKLQPVPVLVKEIPTSANGGISKDGKTLTIHLKDGLKWSDGQPLNADDVVFTLQMYLDKANNFTISVPVQDQVKNPSDIKKVDDTTVSVTTKDAQYPENIFGVNNFFLLPKHIYEPIYKKDKTLEKADENNLPTVFSGPFMLKEWKHGTSLTYVPNPNYVLGAPKIQQVVIRIFPDPQTANAAFIAGDLDMVVNLQVDEINQIKSSLKNADDATFVSVYGSFREALWFNIRTDKYPRAGHPALQDKRVRQAIRMGINRQSLVHDLLGDVETLTDSMWADTPFVNKDITFVKYDPQGAGKLLDEAGWVMGSDNIRQSKNVKGIPDGTKLELTYGSTTASQRKKNMAVIQQDLAKIGIKVTLKNYDPTQFFGPYQDGGITKTGAEDIDEYANNSVTTNPANTRIFECNNITSDSNPGGQNYIGWCNPEFDKLQLVTESAADPKASQDAANRLQQILYDEVPIIILYTRTDKYAYQTGRFTNALNIGAGITNQWYDIVNWEPK
jgi:peptide/nickel transport system substrate-binding protein